MLKHFPKLALPLALRQNDAKGILIALKSGADPALAGSISAYPSRPLDVLHAILSAPNLKLKERDFELLEYASRERRTDVAVQLLDHGAPVDAPGSGGRTALMSAVANGDEAFAKMLAARGADPNRVDQWGTNALALALEPTARPELAATLVALGADGRPMSSGRPTIYTLAAQQPALAIELVRRKIVRVDQDNILAAAVTQPKLLTDLLNIQPSPFSSESKLEALKNACGQGRADTTQRLLDHVGTAAHSMVGTLLRSAGSLEVMKLLLEAKSLQPIAPTDLVEGLLGFSGILSSKTSIESLRLLLAAGANPNHPSTDGRYVLIEAARNRNSEYVDLLLAMKVDPNVRDRADVSALMAAADVGFHEDPSILQRTAMLSRQAYSLASMGSESTQTTGRVLGASPEVIDSIFALLIEPETVGRLLNAGADPNAAGKDGWTPLMRTAAVGCVACAEALLRHSADRGLKNAQGETALDIARRTRHPKVAELLR